MIEITHKTVIYNLYCEVNLKKILIIHQLNRKSEISYTNICIEERIKYVLSHAHKRMFSDSIFSTIDGEI